MSDIFSEEKYDDMIMRLFNRFPSFQKVGAGAYKPGIANMEFADQLMGHPHRNYRIVHVAGTNGKGSVSNMLASCLAASGLKVGLYTSPHIVDFRERMRVIEDDAFYLISKEDVWSFVQQWKDTFDHLDLSFFEITTLMALDWFAARKVDIVVLETGLGGRLDSTNLVSPILSIITNIGLDHCDMLGGTLPEIAFEKAGIIKPKVPVVVGESHPETDAVFERKVLYTNLPEPDFMGNRNAIMSLLTFADKVEPSLWACHEDVLHRMDLQGEYQRKNLRTVMAALDVLSCCGPSMHDALVRTAVRTGFRGRWEKLSDDPYVICDIGHNEHGLKYNFAQLEKMRKDGKCTHIIMVYGSVADKDVDAVLHLMPADAAYVFTQAHGKRALPAEEARDRYLSYCAETGRPTGDVHCCGTVIEAVRHACRLAALIKESDPDALPLIYIGGSTYVVSEAVTFPFTV
ncbi:MAG: bifunctional folylpolyglutamate synthase/dihydrofolate synthase [Bacteroidales bacterium]|nr:bifunctional folylpolyglutamate synthase/dihydrofolate synthase [Bacteroidales bacterium]